MTSEPLPTDVLQDRLDAERATLIREFAATTPAPVVEGYVAAVVAQYKDAQVLSFVPILVRRHVREQLLARTPGNLSRNCILYSVLNRKYTLRRRLV